MMAFDAIDLARFQFGFTVALHIVFPAFSIGLASYLAMLNALHCRTGVRVYLAAFDLWKTILAAAFGMGVVSGIVMSYQFGTNWAVFSDRAGAGPAPGPLMGYEVLTAFFLEAGFLGVTLVTFVLIGMVSLLTAAQDPDYAVRWFTGPTRIFSLIVPVLLLCAWAIWTGLRQGRNRRPFLAAIAIFVLCHLGIGISLHPHIAPSSLTIWQAAAPDSGLRFLLAGAVVLAPMVLAYTAYSYWVFRGKMIPGEGDH